MELISIIVPVYNVEKYLHRCIQSLIKQSYLNIEIILVDDGSTDKSGKLCDDYSNQYEHIKVVHQENGGLSAARNTGIKVASGDFIGFVDSDDWIDKDMYSYLYHLIKRGDYEVSEIAYLTCVNEIELENYNNDETVLTGEDILKFYLVNEDYSVCNKLYKSSLLSKDTFETGIINEDILANFKILSKINAMITSQRVMYFYYYNSNSITNSKFKQRDFDLLKVSNQLVNLISEKNEELRYLAFLKLSRSYFSLLAKIAKYGFHENFKDKKQTIAYLLKNLRKNYTSLMSAKHISFKRKLCITAFCINFNICNSVGIILRKVRR